MNLVEISTVIVDAANAIAANIYQLGIIACIIAALWQAARSEAVTTNKVLIFGIIAICATFAINVVPFHPEQTKSLILFALPVYFAYLYYQKKEGIWGIWQGIEIKFGVAFLVLCLRRYLIEPFSTS